MGGQSAIAPIAGGRGVCSLLGLDVDQIQAVDLWERVSDCRFWQRRGGRIPQSSGICCTVVSTTDAAAGSGALTQPCQSPRCRFRSPSRECGAANAAGLGPGAGVLFVRRGTACGRCPCGPFRARRTGTCRDRVGSRGRDGHSPRSCEKQERPSCRWWSAGRVCGKRAGGWAWRGVHGRGVHGRGRRDGTGRLGGVEVGWTASVRGVGCVCACVRVCVCVRGWGSRGL